jgi:hypothetical protein
MLKRAADARPVAIEVKIIYNVQLGAVTQVDGPMDAPALLFGILELAREAVYVHRADTLKRKTSSLLTGTSVLRS